MSQMVPCEWPVRYGAGCSALSEDSGSEELRLDAEALATEMLWNWTGRIFGTCEVTVRPCRVPVGTPPSTFEGRGPVWDFRGYGSGYPAIGGGWLPVLIGGAWLGLTCGACARSECSCEPSRVKSIALPGPLVSVEQVRIGADILDPSAYRIEQHRWLVRQDGEPWPVTQNLDLAPGEEGTWSIDYTRGIEVPRGGQVAAGVLACELAKALSDDNTCALPKRLQVVARTGVTLAVQDFFEDLKEGGTGIWQIDGWVQAIKQPRPFASVRSPDRPGAGRPAWRT